MKRSFRWIVVTIVVSGAAGWIIWIALHQPVERSTPTVSSDVSAARKLNIPSHIKEPFTTVKDQPFTGNKEFDERAQHTRTLMLEENKPLALFGMVEDQHHDAVPGMKVTLHVGYYDGFVRPDYTGATREFTLQTDNDGRFSLTGQQGKSLYITSVEKMGYLTSQAGFKEFGSRYDLPANSIWPTGEMSADNPVIIPVWKREGSVNLKEDGKAIYTPRGSGPMRVPIAGTPMELEIEWNTPGTDRAPGLWSVKIKVIKGGLQETNDAFPFEAPTSGYQAEWIGGAINEVGATSLSKDFFIVDTNEKYFGRLHATIAPYFRDKSHIGLRWWINPNSERGLLNNTASGD